jgi:GxxExxY protein
MSGLPDPLTERIIACAIEVHRLTGPGLLESVYDVCLAYELQLAGLEFQRQKNVSFDYKGVSASAAFRVDFVVADAVLVELKCVETLLPVHRAQVLTYLRLSGLATGLIINFNVPVLREGLRRVVWTHRPEAASEPPRLP